MEPTDKNGFLEVFMYVSMLACLYTLIDVCTMYLVICLSIHMYVCLLKACKY